MDASKRADPTRYSGRIYRKMDLSTNFKSTVN
jgi:hypothetical protein